MSESQEQSEQYELDRARDHFKRYRRFERVPHAAGDLLSRLISRRGFTQEQFCDELQNVWQKVAGKQFEGKTQATVIKRGTLEILVESSPAMQQLAFYKSKLLAQLQSELPDAQIKSIRFKVGRINS